MKRLLLILALLLAPLAAHANLLIVGSQVTAGTPLAVGLATVFPVAYDNAAGATQVAPVNVTMTAGLFAGTLGFATASGSDLAVDGTTSTIVSSASHNFAILTSGTDLQATVTSPLWAFHSASYSFTDSDLPTQVQITGGTGWNAGNAQCFAGTTLNPNQPCAWTTICTATSAGVCPYGGGARPVAGDIGVMHTGQSGPSPFTAASTCFPGGACPAGGAIGATTYWVRTTFNTAGGETLPTVSTSQAVTASHLLNVNQATVTGATSWNVYVGTSRGAETLQASSIALGTTWTEPASGLIAGAAPPTSGLGGAWQIVRSTEIGQDITVTGGAGCTTGVYHIVGYSGVNAILDRPPAAVGVTGCTWTMTYDNGGHYALSASNLVVATNGTAIGNANDYVKLKATQNGVTATSAMLAVNRVSQTDQLFASVSPPGVDGIYFGGAMNGYAMHYATSSGAPPQVPGGPFNVSTTTPQWTNRGGDCYGSGAGAISACGTGTPYATATPSAGAFVNFTATSLVADAVAVNAAAMVNVAFTSTGFEQITACSDPTAPHRPSILYTYTDTSTDLKYCVGSNPMSTTETYPHNVFMTSPMGVASGTNIGMSFPRPNALKTVSTAVVALWDVSGTTAMQMWRMAPPYASTTLDPFPTISSNYIQDGCSGTSPAITCTMANDAAVIFYAEGGETLTNKFNTSFIDCTNPTKFDFSTPGDPTKLPQLSSPFGSPSAWRFQACEGNDTSLGASIIPQVVTGTFNQHGYVGYATAAPDAWMWTVVPAMEVINDAQLFFNATTDGVQPGNGRASTQADGTPVTNASGAVLPPGRLPNELYYRVNARWSNEWIVPDNATIQMGGKGGSLGWAHISSCGNGGFPCDGTHTDGSSTAFNISESGRYGWTKRAEVQQVYNPGDPFYRDFILGEYLYFANLSQSDYLWGPKPLHRDEWYCLEGHLKLNDIVRTSPANAAGGRAVTLGTGYSVNDLLTVVEGTGTPAILHVTSVSGGQILATDLASGGSAGNYSVFPISPVTVTGGTGTGATFSLSPVDTASANAVVEGWVNGVKIYSSPASPNAFKFRGTPPYMNNVAASAGARPPVFGDAGIEAAWFNYFFGGVYGGFPGATNAYWFVNGMTIATTRVGCMRLSANDALALARVG